MSDRSVEVTVENGIALGVGATLGCAIVNMVIMFFGSLIMYSTGDGDGGMFYTDKATGCHYISIDGQNYQPRLKEGKPWCEGVSI